MAFDREARPARPNRGKRRKVCQFCADKCEYIDYKDAAKLRRFVSERSKILPHRWADNPISPRSAKRTANCRSDF